MRVYIVLCLVAVAYGENGYNYQAGQGHGSHGNSVSSIGSSHGSLGSSQGSISSGIPLSSGGSQSAGSSGPNIASAPAEYSKEFYSYSAPDNEFDDDNAQQHISNALKKNLKVIFIKGPESKGLENVALQLAQQAGQSKTAIYVLQKQDDVSSLVQQLQNNPQSPSAPEVHFVKYRTAQDAQNAQKAIQSQYDQLPGSSQSHSGGQAPVLNFASPSQSISGSSAPQAPKNAYLPASVLKLFR